MVLDATSLQVAGRTKSLFSTMKKLLRLDSMETGGRARQEVHDILASRCMVTPHPDLPATQAEHLATQVSLFLTLHPHSTAAHAKDSAPQVSLFSIPERNLTAAQVSPFFIPEPSVAAAQTKDLVA